MPHTLPPLTPSVNKHLQNPPHLALRRQELYNITWTHLTRREWDTYFPYISNVWCKKGNVHKRQRDGAKIEHWYCRFSSVSRRVKQRSKDSLNYDTSQPRVNKMGQKARTPLKPFCNGAFRTEALLDGTIRLIRVKEHSDKCSLDRCDGYKVNDGVRRVAEKLVRGGMESAPAVHLLKGDGTPAHERQWLDAGAQALTSAHLSSWKKTMKKKSPEGFAMLDRSESAGPMLEAYSDLPDSHNEGLAHSAPKKDPILATVQRDQERLRLRKAKMIEEFQRLEQEEYELRRQEESRLAQLLD